VARKRDGARPPTGQPASRPVRLGFGHRPALLVIDFLQAYTTPGSPLHAPGVVSAVGRLPPLLRAARAARIPILHTGVLYNPRNFEDGGAWIRKAPVLKLLVPENPLSAFDSAACPAAGETVVIKNYSSAFAGTSVAATLAAARVDTVLMAGCTTSGCIRASAVDAIQNGFRPMIIAECVGDRHADPHRAALRDIDEWFGDVVSRAEAIRYLFGLHPESSTKGA
jgi:maleamate amidohydrolase